MSITSTALAKTRFASYSFNRTIVPFPHKDLEKAKPPEVTNKNVEVKNTTDLFKTRVIDNEEKARQYMSNYLKAERIVMVNFYTGGGPYRKGALDAIYRGFNPMNP